MERLLRKRKPRRICILLLGKSCQRLRRNSGIDEYDRLSDAFNNQRAVGRVFGNKEIAGIVDLSDIVAQKHFGIRVELEKILGNAAYQEYPLIFVGMRMSVAAQRIRSGDICKSYRQLGSGYVFGTHAVIMGEVIVLWIDLHGWNSTTLGSLTVFCSLV